MEVEERRKDRARVLLQRHGILFRELLTNESPQLRWGAVFKALRLMELSGEVVAGYFFEGIPGPQFISHQALRTLRRGLGDQGVHWLSATDPASACGLNIEALRGVLPSRLPTTHLVFKGPDLVLVSRRQGNDLTFSVPPDDPDLPECLAPLRHLLTRRFEPRRRIAVETINGQRADQSPYADVLRTCFEALVDYKGVTLYQSPGQSSLG